MPTDKEDRPLDPVPRITHTEVLQNPFDDIISRVDPKRALEKTEDKVKSQSKGRARALPLEKESPGERWRERATGTDTNDGHYTIVTNSQYYPK